MGKLGLRGVGILPEVTQLKKCQGWELNSGLDSWFLAFFSTLH
jgi:hypothetical protein